jgi:hypothetical protein
MDFFLWGYAKNCAYGEKIGDLQHLQERIATAIATVTPDVIQRTWHEIEYRLDVRPSEKWSTYRNILR